MKAKFLIYREWVWPLIEKDSTDDDNSSTQSEQVLIIDEENLELAFQLQSKMHEDEEDRRKGTESKAALFMGSLSVATSVILASNAFVWNDSTPALVKVLTATISCLLAIYTFRTVWFSVKVLERGRYHVLGFKEVNISGDKQSYLKHLIDTIANMVKENESTINMKVTNLVMAQEYYKRAIVLISIYAILTLAFSFCF